MKKILVVEDNGEVRENIVEILELSGYDVCAAENGKNGVELSVREQPDLILCDVMMPELDGFGMLKILNRNPRTMDIPFIFLTAKAEKSDFRKGMGLGADDYITKPFDDTELLEAVEMRIKKSDRIKKSFDRTEEGLHSFFSEARANQELQKLSDNREVRKYRKKDIIYEEHQYPQWLYFIAAGKIKIFKTNEFGKELIVAIHNEGEFFGHVPLIREDKYEDSASALEDCSIRLIPKDDFYLLLRSNRDFSSKFIKMLANERSEMEDKLINLAYNSVRKKVADALISLASKYGNGNDTNFSILREDLASIAGTAKETVIRTLSDFKEEGLIDIHSHNIVIKNLEKLSGMPN